MPEDQKDLRKTRQMALAHGASYIACTTEVTLTALAQDVHFTNVTEDFPGTDDSPFHINHVVKDDLFPGALHVCIGGTVQIPRYKRRANLLLCPMMKMLEIMQSGAVTTLLVLEEWCIWANQEGDNFSYATARLPIIYKRVNYGHDQAVADPLLA